MSTDSAVAREAAWLAQTGDGLPSLLSPPGPWQNVQPYWPRTPATNQSGIYVTRSRLAAAKPAAQRIRPGYAFRLKMTWPLVGVSAPVFETAQQEFDEAVHLLVIRIVGPLGDKSHGGRFLSAGETPGRPPEVTVEFEDPEECLARYSQLRASATYSVDDYETSG